MSHIDWGFNNPYGWGEDCMGAGYDSLKYFDFNCIVNDEDVYNLFCSAEWV